MPVYLEIVPAPTRAPNTGHQVLEGHQCLVFFSGGIPNQTRPQHTGGVNMLMCDGSVRFVKDEDEIVAALSRMPSGSFNTVIIGPSPQIGYLTTRWSLTPASKELPSLGLTKLGGEAAVIGLLLPAVQKVRDAVPRGGSSFDLVSQLKTLVGPGGRVFVVGSYGELLPA